MKLSIQAGLLKEAIADAGTVIPNRSMMQVLLNVLMIAKRGKLQVSGTNAEMSATRWVSAQITEDGAITVPYKLLSDLLKQMSDTSDVLMSVNATRMTLTINCDGITVDIKGIDPDEFPQVIIEKLGNGTIISAKKIKQFQRQVAFAAAAPGGNSIPLLTGIQFVIGDNTIHGMATDQYRVASAAKKLDRGYPAVFVIPQDSFSKLASALPSNADQVHLHATRSQVIWHVPDVMQVITQQFENNGRSFPEAKSFIKQNKAEIRINRIALLKAAKTVGIMANVGDGCIFIEVETNQLTIASVGEETGRTDAIVEAQIAGGPCSITASVIYMIDAIESFPNTVENILIRVSADGRYIDLQSGDVPAGNNDAIDDLIQVISLMKR